MSTKIYEKVRILTVRPVWKSSTHGLTDLDNVDVREVPGSSLLPYDHGVQSALHRQAGICLVA